MFYGKPMQTNILLWTFVLTTFVFGTFLGVVYIFSVIRLGYDSTPAKASLRMSLLLFVMSVVAKYLFGG